MLKTVDKKKEETTKKEIPKPEGEYIYAVGRRKEASAQVRLYSGKGKIIVNEKEYSEYFPTFYLQRIVLQPLKLTKLQNKFDVITKVKGGGIRGQAEAIRLGIARCLVKYDLKLKPSLKGAGLLRRDARVKERKKPGLKRARRAPQWQKR